MKLRSELTGAAVWERGEVERNLGFSFTFLSHFWNLWMKRNESVQSTDILGNRYVALSFH